jgi:hypothetical protein
MDALRGLVFSPRSGKEVGGILLGRTEKFNPRPQVPARTFTSWTLLALTLPCIASLKVR